MTEIKSTPVAVSVALKVKKVLDGIKLPFFLIAHTARAVHRPEGIDGFRALQFGCFIEDFQKVEGTLGPAFRGIASELEVIQKPLDYSRAIKFYVDGILIILASYHQTIDHHYVRICPMSNGKGALPMALNLLKGKKKKRIGAKWFVVPDPIGDYLGDIFDDSDPMSNVDNYKKYPFVEIGDPCIVDPDPEIFEEDPSEIGPDIPPEDIDDEKTDPNIAEK